MKTLKWNDYPLGVECPAITINGVLCRILAELDDDDGCVAIVREKSIGYMVHAIGNDDGIPAPTLEEAKALAVALVQLNE